MKQKTNKEDRDLLDMCPWHSSVFVRRVSMTRTIYLTVTTTLELIGTSGGGGSGGGGQWWIRQRWSGTSPLKCQTLTRMGSQTFD